MRRRSLLFACGALASMTACGEVVSGVDADIGSLTQFETTRWGEVASTRWFLLVVDDAPTEAARSLRQHLAEDFRGLFDDLDDADCFTGADPAVYRPIDMRLIVVGASGTLEPRFRHDEGLHALGADASAELLEAFEDAVAEAILETETAEALPFVGEFELVHYVNLIEGDAEPRNDAEAELSNSVPAGKWPWAALAKTRPDVSPAGAALNPGRSVWNVNLLDWPEDGSCPDTDGLVVVPAFNPLVGVWTSPDCYEEATVFSPSGYAKCVTPCMSRIPAVDDSGQVSCRVYGEFPADVDCEESSGWSFLETTGSQWSLEDAPPVNLCELRQAEGDALAACIDDFACEACEPSFCFRRPFTEADEVNPAHRRPIPAADSVYCELSGNTDVPWDRLRIVHGADQVNALIRVVCQE